MTWIILGPLMLYVALLGTANTMDDWNPNKYSWYCYENRKEYSTVRKLVPWPFRMGTFDINVPGNKNKCTGEVYNGQWWHRP